MQSCRLMVGAEARAGRGASSSASAFSTVREGDRYPTLDFCVRIDAGARKVQMSAAVKAAGRVGESRFPARVCAPSPLVRECVPPSRREGGSGAAVSGVARFVTAGRLSSDRRSEGVGDPAVSTRQLSSVLSASNKAYIDLVIASCVWACSCICYMLRTRICIRLENGRHFCGIEDI